MSADETKPVPRWQAGDWFFRCAVPAYIALGAVMKLLTGQPLQLPLVSLVRDPSAAAERWAGVALPVLCAVELTVAGTLLLGGRWARWLALAVLVGFAGVLAPHVVAAANSCGCFGAVSTSPTLMLITAVGGALLILLLPATGRAPFPASSRSIVPWATAVVIVVAGVQLGRVPERMGWRVPTIRLRPEDWVGKRLQELPFFSALEGAQAGSFPGFSEPTQTWVLWLRSCPHCHEYFRERWSEPTGQRIVAVEVPPSSAGVSPQPHSIECPSCVRLHLRKGAFYFLPRTPAVLTVENGVVTAVDVNPTPAAFTPSPTLDGP